MNRSLSFNKLINLGALAGLIVWAAISLGGSSRKPFPGKAAKTCTPIGTQTIIRKGKEYYITFINNELPLVPVKYLDCKEERLDEIIFPSLIPTHASTNPIFS
jgi:hypothetical protein